MELTTFRGFQKRKQVFDQPLQMESMGKSSLSNSLELATKSCGLEARVFWAGAHPPYGWMESSLDIYSGDRGYRLTSGHHQAFDVVYLTERDLATIKAWPLVLDEALRLLRPQGYLVLRFHNSALLSIFALKQQIGAWGEFTLVSEEHHPELCYVLTIRNDRKSPRQTNADGWTFGIITDGRRPNELRAIVDNIGELRRRHAGRNIELLICGPIQLEGSLGTTPVEFSVIPEPLEHRKSGWITRKKNLLVNATVTENLVVLHDRYRIPADFLHRMDDFGSDFSVVAPRQQFEDGRRFPDWVTLNSQWSWTTPATMAYQDWSPHAFINGGAIIAKAEVLRMHPWNELLFWGQAEDIELSRRLTLAGHIPRLARGVVLVTVAVRSEFMSGFGALPYSAHSHAVVGPSAKVDAIVPPFYVREPFAFTKNVDNAASRGVTIGDDWRDCDAGLLLEPGVYGEISFRIAGVAHEDLELSFDVAWEPQGLTALINESAAAVQTEAGRLSVVLEKDVANRTSLVRVHLLARSGVVLTAMELRGSEADAFGLSRLNSHESGAEYWRDQWRQVGNRLNELELSSANFQNREDLLNQQLVANQTALGDAQRVLDEIFASRSWWLLSVFRHARERFGTGGGDS